MPNEPQTTGSREPDDATIEAMNEAICASAVLNVNDLVGRVAGELPGITIETARFWVRGPEEGYGAHEVAVCELMVQNLAAKPEGPAAQVQSTFALSTRPDGPLCATEAAEVVRIYNEFTPATDA